MPIVLTKSRLSDLSVREAMRMQVISLASSSSIETGIRTLIKYKISGLLLTSQDESPVGVVTKTDIMAAYYASLPIDSPLEHIMMSPPLYCAENDSLESALDLMRSKSVYRLYVMPDIPGRVVGVLAYRDIVGLLYQYCRTCENSIAKRETNSQHDWRAEKYKVGEVMTTSVRSFSDDDSLSRIMEGLSLYHFGAVLIRDAKNVPVGVISKTDLMLAYRRGILSHVPAKTVLWSYRVISCDESEFLEDAIRRMIFSEVHRVFVHKTDPNDIVGVFSLSDAARLRSGSCQACVSTRIQVDATA